MVEERHSRYNTLLSSNWVAEDAQFDSRARTKFKECLPDTRSQLLQEIQHWADCVDSNSVLWLSGSAGTGKSTVAQTIAHHYYHKNRLAGSFFFSRIIGGGRAAQAKWLVATIAEQLAGLSNSIKDHISAAIDEHNDIIHKDLRRQWDILIRGPLSKSEGPPSLPLVLVIDALDECDSKDDMSTIVQILAELSCVNSVSLRILLTSRPENAIRQAFAQVGSGLYNHTVLDEIPSRAVDHDIQIYVTHELELIRTKGVFPASLDFEDTVNKLTRRSAGLFQWAATACRYISDDGNYFFTDKRLHGLLNRRDATQSANSHIGDLSPEDELDNLYLTILRASLGHRSPAENIEFLDQLKVVLGSLAISFSSLSLTHWAAVLDCSPNKVDSILQCLRAIVLLPEKVAGPIRLHHPSFRDFILSPNRCKDRQFLVDERKGHQLLANRSIRLGSSKLIKNILGLPSPGSSTQEVYSRNLVKKLPLGIEYTCQYWTMHLKRGCAVLKDNDEIDVFLRKHFLHWIEVLSLTGKLPNAVHDLITLAGLVDVSVSYSLNYRPCKFKSIRFIAQVICDTLFTMRRDLFCITGLS